MYTNYGQKSLTSGNWWNHSFLLDPHTMDAPPTMVAPLVLQTQVIFAGIINTLVLWLTNVNLPVQSQKTTRPVNSGDECLWPFSKSLFYITDYNTGLCVLVDTGAEVSIIPSSKSKWKNPQVGFRLQAASNSPITTYGKRSLTLNLGLRCTFQWLFIIADIKNPILGVDFLNHFKLVVDMKNKCRLDTCYTAQCTRNHYTWTTSQSHLADHWSQEQLRSSTTVFSFHY